MSPYTSAWGHYVTALFFKLFGTDLFIYRLSGISLVISGVAFLSLALRNMGQARAAAILPCIIAFFSAAVINHRFAIEINTFHVFCFGLLTWGLSEKASFWRSNVAILASIVLGVTSHVLFLAPALALLVLVFWQDGFLPKNDPGSGKRGIAGAALILLAGFFLRIHLGIPEKDKSFALLLIASLSLLGIIFPQLTAWAVQLTRKYAGLPLRVIFLSTCFAALFFLLFFSEGSWAAAFFNGGQSDVRVMIWPVLAIGIGIASSWKNFRILFEQEARWNKAFLWALLTVIFTAAMATKPAPRYFEIPFLLLACVFALALAHAPKRIAAVALFIWIIAGSLQLDRDYLRPALAGDIPERPFRFLFFKDNSSDTLSKQKLSYFLAKAGCRFEQVRSNDVRILEPLKFLSLGDWPLHGTACRFGSQVQVERKSQLSSLPAHLPAQGVENGPFILYTALHP